MPIDPADLQHVYSGASREAAGLVDHTFHLDKHPNPELARAYRDGVLGSPGIVRPATEKQHAGPQAHFIALPAGHRFAVTPYHQALPLHLTHVLHYPLAGWSQMTTQALYHAGGIGHLVAHTHVAEHPTANGEYEPLLVEHIDPHFVPYSAARHEGHPQVMSDAAKVGFLDFLTNNQSRTAPSMLLSRPIGPDASDRLRVTGSADAFGYKRPNRYQQQHTKFDHLFYYLADSPGMARLAHGAARVHGSGAVNDAVQWWKQHGQGLRSTLADHLSAISSSRVSGHIHSNFESRAAALDRLAEAWGHNQDMTSFSPYRWKEGHDQRVLSSLPMVPVFIHDAKGQ